MATILLLTGTLGGCTSKKLQPKRPAPPIARPQPQQQPQTAPAQVQPAVPMVRRALLAQGEDDFRSLQRLVFALSSAAPNTLDSKTIFSLDHDRQTLKVERVWRGGDGKTGIDCTATYDRIAFKAVHDLLFKAQLVKFPAEVEPDPLPARCMTLIFSSRGPQIYSFFESDRRTICSTENVALIKIRDLALLEMRLRKCPATF